ncbi:MAG: hypothetical protein ACYDAG_02450 [Chloroflexota bacterium]
MGTETDASPACAPDPTKDMRTYLVREESGAETEVSADSFEQAGILAREWVAGGSYDFADGDGTIWIETHIIDISKPIPPDETDEDYTEKEYR